MKFSQSLASLPHRRSHANVRSAIYRFGNTTNFFAVSERLTISMFTRDMIFFNVRRNIGS